VNVEMKANDLKEKKWMSGLRIRLTLMKRVNFLDVKTHYCPELNCGSIPGTPRLEGDARACFYDVEAPVG